MKKGISLRNGLLLGAMLAALCALLCACGAAPGADANVEPLPVRESVDLPPHDSGEDLLLVVDFQNVCLPEQPMACPTMEQSMENTLKIVRAPNAPDYLLTKYTAPENPTGRWVTYNEVNAEINADAFLCDFAEAVKPLVTADNVIERDTYSVMDSPELADRLSGKQRVVLTGVVADCCVLATMLDAIDLGYEVYYLYDCISGPSTESEQDIMALAEVFSPVHTQVMSSDDYIRLLAPGQDVSDQLPVDKPQSAADAAFRLWTEDAPARTAIIDYVSRITDEGSDSYIPPEDRIAVFDLDGTLMCETYPWCFEYMVFADYALNQPDYTPTEEVRAVAQEILDSARQEKPSGISARQAAMAAIAYAGMTPGELEDYVRRFMDSSAEGFTNLKRGDAFYRPMLELVDYLEENGFTIYIVTATERNIVRSLVKDTLGIPPARVIGTEYGYTATGQGDAADSDYTFQDTDKVVFDGNYYGENAKMSKVDAIVREIGQQPLLAFGNSSGDLAMCEYVVANNPYPALSYIVLADDAAREWGDSANQAKAAEYAAMGIGAISMRDDFVTIYGEDVEKIPNTPENSAGTETNG